ncbi:MAG: acyltransferase [Thiothrix sp.]|nr:acyltransferase [Thiothrix sp.]HPE60675.1 acyltransferase [Thiolinea sp.]
MQYRKELDGLRAVVTLPILLFDADITGFAGGFAGIDMLFAISGYLATLLILEQRASGCFSLATFYERRLRRVLPALFLVMLLCLPMAWFWLLPHELAAFGRSLITIPLLGANIQFWLETDYFSEAAGMMPLLHTWSLAVGAQFFLLLPILLPVLMRHRPNIRHAVLLLLFFSSLGWSEWLWRRDLSGNYYLAGSRLWELLAGVLAAHWQYHARCHPGKSLRQGLALLGLVLILASISLLDQTLPFPGLYAVPPVLGTVLVLLFAGPDNLTGRLLALTPLAGLGLTACSAYLWHQPVFAFVRIISLETPGEWLMLLLIFIVLQLSYFSWYLVEKPFRQGQGVPADHHRFLLLATAFTLLFLLLGLACILYDGFPGRFIHATPD